MTGFPLSTMNDGDCTLTSPVQAASNGPERLLALTVLWHPDRTRIGQQFFGPAGPGALALGRFAPLFRHPGQEGTPLEHRCIARAPIELVREYGDTVRMEIPDSRMALRLDGAPLCGVTRLDEQQVQRGAVLELGATVLVCLHWASRLPQHNPVPELLGVSSLVLALRDQVRQVARTNLHVLLLGETGTGKDVAARAIHAGSMRARSPYVAVNMATLNEALAAADLFGAAKGAYTGAQTARGGLFADAGDGTLFLDEIGDTPAGVQPMLLRVLESGEYRPLGARADVHTKARLICATDQDLAARGFNQALLRRLEAFVMRLPPLRERREDIGILIEHFLHQWSEQHGVVLELPLSFIGELCQADWPGNIRQLRHVVRRAALAVQAGEQPQLANFYEVRQAEERIAAPVEAQKTGSKRVKLAALETDAVLSAMDCNGWQISGAAQQLGVSRPSMYKLIESHPGIRRAEAISVEELQAALLRHGADLQRCAAILRTPCEPLRRHLRARGLIA